VARSYPPEPEESGFLDPPRRHPPTAVATATPPPPYRRGNYRGFRSRTRLIATAVLAASMGLAGVASFATLTFWGAALGLLGCAGSFAISIHMRHELRTRGHKTVRQGRRAA
jgi:hypothetical protein